MGLTRTSFTPATAIKSPGRPVGSKNKTTEQTRDFMKRIVDRNLFQLQEDLDKMSPFQRWQIVKGLMPFIMPTYSMNMNKNDNSGQMEFVIKYSDAPVKNKEVGNEDVNE